MRKLLVLILSITLIIGASSLSFGASYTDINPSNWAYEAVNTMSNKAIVKGYPDGTFKPDNTVKYGEFIKMALIAATGVDVGNSASGNWAENYYNKAVDLGYFTPYDISKASLDDKITRAHMALIISSILGKVDIKNYDEIQKTITDVTYKTPYEYDITKAYACGILTGYTDKTFRPEKTLSRAESATVIYRLIDESKRVLPFDEKETSTPTEKKVTIGYPRLEKTFDLTLETAKLGDYGISKFQVLANGDVAIFSTVRYEKVVLIIDNMIMTSVGNANGNDYWQEDGYYIYLATPKADGVSTKGKIPSVLVSGKDEVIQIANTTL